MAEYILREYGLLNHPGAVLLTGTLAFALLLLPLGATSSPSPRTTWLHAGDDGLLLSEVASIDQEARHRLIQFISYSSIALAGKDMADEANEPGTTSRHVVVLKLGTGKIYKLALGHRTPEVWQRICDARARFESATCDGATSFCRRDTTVEAWLVALRKLGNVSHDPYRGSQFAIEQMWRIVEAPSAAPTARCGAAVALRTYLDESGCRRMLSAARGVVAPGVREALEAAARASTSDAELAEALAKVYDRSMTSLA
ncbi:hypothetical protein [Sorangium cellulosum]|uniref:hypothetical protein n=1 Tax=Sorangium cellulosum TaxID=56 RepID=UPI00133196FC|nr:hypothetical protein [Sorangium cellulosum]